MGIIALFINKTYPSCPGAGSIVENHEFAWGIEAGRGSAAMRFLVQSARSFYLRGISTGAWANIVKCLRYLGDSRALAKENQERRGPGMKKAGFYSTGWFLGIGVVPMDVGV